MTQLQLAIQLFLQIAVILAACRLVGIVARWFGQPQVVAEMITGVMLGPSLLQWIWPYGFGLLFPAESMKVLFPLSQLGLALYMFVVGLEFRVDVMTKRAHSAAAVSLAGMIAPFVLGAGLAVVFYKYTQLFPSRTSLFEAAVFLGASMCITAFPMLARIIHFKGLAGTTMGTVALGAGAMDDAFAWGLLAVVLASFDGSVVDAVPHILGGIAYAAVTLFAVRPALAAWARRLNSSAGLSDGQFAACLGLMALGAFVTDAIGLHAVFGAFVMGVAMPRGVVSSALIERVQPLTVALLLPLFFTYSGLNTRIGLLSSGPLWIACTAVMVAAVAGKGVACWLAARATGIPNRQAMGIGTLMNARGLMELIIINIGRSRGIISDELFAILVVMAVLTTLMASPLFERLVGSERIERSDSNSTSAGPMPAMGA
jgi:Kef-type K+ transport system membrane component KefB